MRHAEPFPSLFGDDVEVSGGNKEAAGSDRLDKAGRTQLADVLPRGQPFVGFLRHAPRQRAMSPHGRYAALLAKRRRKHRRDRADAVDSGAESLDSDGKGLHKLEEILPRESPYVGFSRHAPPSPTLDFLTACRPFGRQMSELDLADEFSDQGCLGGLPDELLAKAFAFIADIRQLRCWLSLARGFEQVLHLECVWRHAVICIEPEMVQGFAPHLGDWLPAWKQARKLLVPQSKQLLAEIRRQDPDMMVEVAWRFDRNLCGDGVEVLRNGRTVRRIEEDYQNTGDSLVVLADAPLSRVLLRGVQPADQKATPVAMPYFEVRLDELPEDDEELVNEFGLGVTTCDTTDFNELGVVVADEVPDSWVVDFARSSITLNVNNVEQARSRAVTASSLFQGDRVGLRITADGALEIFINGCFRERLSPKLEDRIKADVDLVPVLDLYGRTRQVTVSYAESLTL
eukprot:TRINITY_DN31763_c0_g2_i1.p1 TRINITY_DN31763_c0_g2~~TRINITY_DN31763_c0_g2_i1.p1  ORF type:complete len:457 (-),score=96.97 TRINITY_DN31763_c0_g2_i1:98-1468(-)